MSMEECKIVLPFTSVSRIPVFRVLLTDCLISSSSQPGMFLVRYVKIKKDLYSLDSVCYC